MVIITREKGGFAGTKTIFPLTTDNDESSAIAWDGTYLYVTNSSTGIHKVYKYNLDIELQSEHALTGVDEHAVGVIWDGSTYFYVLEGIDETVTYYNASWVYQGIAGALDVLNADPQGMAFNGTNLFVVDWTDKKVYEYNTNMVLQDTYTLDALNASPIGICWDGEFFYITDTIDIRVYKYDASFTLIEHYPLSGINQGCFGIEWDGTYFWVIDENDDEVYRYEIVTSTDITANTHNLEILEETRNYAECVFKNHVDSLAIDDIIKVTDRKSTWKYGKGNRKDSLHFRNETWGSVPADTSQGTWLDNSGGDCAVYMIDKNNGHSNIIQFEDYDNSNNAELYFTFTSAQTDGSIEYWYMTTDPTYQFGFFCYDEGDGLAAGIHQYDDLWYYWDNTAGGSWQAMGGTAPVVGKWYRITITFDCGTDKVTYTIVDDDDIAIANADNKNMASTPTTINKIWLFTRDANLNYLVFIDAIGFTWDANYALGDNANLEITEEDATIFYGAVIKKDKKKNKEYICRTLAFNMTYIKPAQIETGYAEENLAELIIDNTTQIELTAHDKIHRGTYNFINDIVGADVTPMGWLDTSTGTSTVGITTDIDGHKKLLVLTDNQNSSYAEADYFFEGQGYGTLEYWLYTTDVTKIFAHWFRNDATLIFNIDIDNSQFRYYDGATHNIVGVVNATHYRIRIDFECTAGAYLGLAQYKFNAYIYNADGSERGKIEGAAFASNEAEINGMYFNTGNADTGYIGYISSLGFTWDKRYPEYVDYEIGDNKYLLYEHIEPTGQKYDLEAEGGKSLDNLANAIADEDLKHWYLKTVANGYAFCLDDGAFNNQITITTADKIKEVDVIEQMERINKVVLDGGLGTTPQTAVNQDNIDTFGARIFTDTYAHIHNNPELLIIAQQILVRKAAVPSKVALTWYQTEFGMTQVGEVITLGAGIKIPESDETIDAGVYIIQKIYYTPDHKRTEFILTSGLIFEKDVV